MSKGRTSGRADGEKGKIFCANCRHCILMKQPVGQQHSYVLRVRCGHHRWKKKSGEEKVHKYFTLMRRTVSSCSDYEPMGDVKTFLRELKDNLPVKDEIYSY